MHWQSLGYAVACVAVPVMWGLLVVWASNTVERLLQKRRNAHAPLTQEESFPPIDYHI